MQPGHNAAFRALSRIPGVTLFFALPKPAGLYKADLDHFDWMDRPYVFEWFAKPPSRLTQYLSSAGIDERHLSRRLEAFDPDLLLANSWHVPAYRRVMARYRERPRVMRIDNHWTGSLRQRLAARLAEPYLHRLFDAVLVDSARTAVFAKRMGYRDASIWTCGQTCDREAFAAIHERARQTGTPHGRAFIYVGRLVARKGVADLLEAYRRYRATSADPWPLIVCGAGPLADRLTGEAGMDYRGFVQPRDLPEVFREARCLVLPSHAERWGDVIHEAASSGLAVIATRQCGAADVLVADGENGHLLDAGDTDRLTRFLRDFAERGDPAQRAMGRRSFSLAARFSPARWAACVHDHARRLLNATDRMPDGPDFP